jgi:hypothetical protein
MKLSGWNRLLVTLAGLWLTFVFGSSMSQRYHADIPASRLLDLTAPLATPTPPYPSTLAVGAVELPANTFQAFEGELDPAPLNLKKVFLYALTPIVIGWLGLNLSLWIWRGFKSSN